MNSDNNRRTLQPDVIDIHEENTLDESPIARELRLNQIKQAVRAGNYSVDVKKVAKALERDLFTDEEDS